MLGNGNFGTPFEKRMNLSLKAALSGGNGKYSNGCSESIQKLVIAFFTKVSSARIEWSGTNPIAVNLEVLTKVVEQLAYNTYHHEVIPKEQMEYIQKIFDEFRFLYDELVRHEHLNNYDIGDIAGRIDCLYEILYKNHILSHNVINPIHDGKLFQSYENLYKVIRTINRRWNKLVASGFSISVFDDFYDCFVYERKQGIEKTEEKKLELFMGILDGSMRFSPVYEQQAVAYHVVPVGTSKYACFTIPSNYSKGYSLKPNKVEAS